MRSWNHKRGAVFTSKFESKGKSKGASADGQLYHFRGANLTQTQQNLMAKSRLKEILSHERVANLTNQPGDVTVMPPMGLRLTGTGTGADQDYPISTVVHHFSMDGGYTMDISANDQDDSRGEPTQVATPAQDLVGGIAPP